MRNADPVAALELQRLQASFVSTGVRFPPEESPFSALCVDLTHRCNMACRNCYIPVRGLPDLPVEWLYDMLARLPHRTRIRLMGAEPTVRTDLPDIVTGVRRAGHIPLVLTNGLKLGRASYLAELKAAGLRTVYLSLNGGLRDDLYETIDSLACADRKLQALDNLLAMNMNVITGTILIPGVNDGHLNEFIPWLIDRGVRDIHLRSVGPIGDYMDNAPYDLAGLEACLRTALGEKSRGLECTHESGASRDYRAGGIRFQLTEWPEFGNMKRGRISPQGYVEPMFESMVANENQY